MKMVFTNYVLLVIIEEYICIVHSIDRVECFEEDEKQKNEKHEKYSLIYAIKSTSWVLHFFLLGGAVRVVLVEVIDSILR
jgi:hypothetical protein